METLADVLAAGRSRTTLSQEQVGDLIGRTGSAVGKWERGESVPSALDLGLLASVLPLERTPAQLSALRRKALRIRQKEEEVAVESPLEREVRALSARFRTLGEHLDQLDEVVAFLENG